jgi:hypothetical protein
MYFVLSQFISRPTFLAHRRSQTIPTYLLFPSFALERFEVFAFRFYFFLPYIKAILMKFFAPKFFYSCFSAYYCFLPLNFENKEKNANKSV